MTEQRTAAHFVSSSVWGSVTPDLSCAASGTAVPDGEFFLLRAVILDSLLLLSEAVALGRWCVPGEVALRVTHGCGGGSVYDDQEGARV